MSHPIELSTVRAFICVAEELHFARAAARANLSQPALSQQIRKLESHLGTPLFLRSTRRVELTAAGESFLPYAREVLAKLEEAALMAKLAAGGMSAGGSRLNIAAIAPAAYRLLPQILRRFCKRFPETRIELRICGSADQVRGLERGDYHVGIMRPPTNANLLRFHPLTADRFVAVIPRRSPLARRSGLTLADFVGHAVFMLRGADLLGFPAVLEHLARVGIVLRTQISVSNTGAALAAASAGLGITFLPEWVKEIAGEEVAIRNVEDLVEQIPVGIGWMADNPVPGIQPFIEYAEIVARAGG